MVTMEAKVKKAEEQYQGNPTIIVRLGKAETEIKNPELAENLRLAFKFHADKSGAAEALKTCNAIIQAVAREHLGERGTISFVLDDLVVKVTFGHECVIPEENLATVKKILGSARYADLVREKIEYRGTSKLVELASDADRGREIRKWIVIKEKAPSITFETVA